MRFLYALGVGPVNLWIGISQFTLSHDAAATSHAFRLVGLVRWRVIPLGGCMSRSNGTWRKYFLLAGLLAINVSLAVQSASATDEEVYRGVCETCTAPSGDFACCVITACGGENQPACACKKHNECGEN